MKRPSLTFDVKIGEETRQIKYSYGLSQDLQRLVPDFGAAVNDILGDPAIRDYMVRRALTEKKGVVTNEDELISFEAVDDLDPDEVLKLLEWLGDHLLYFFVTSAGTMSRQAKEYSNELGLSNLSTSGSPDSASTTPSVGPSE